MSWELTPGDGIKDVYYECKDSVGNTATPVSATITLDSSNPTVNILSPKEGETYNSPFDLSLIITDASTKQVTCSGNLDGGPTTIGYLDVGVEDTMSIATTPGYHTLEITCNDGVNSNTATASFYITDQPTVEIVINGGATYANSQVVDIEVTASSDVISCHFSNEERMWDAWVPYTEHGLWVLSAGDGFKTVYAQCRNTEGIDSEIASDSIYLDTRYQKPISIEIDNGDGWTNSRDVTLGLYCSGASECRYRNKDEDWSGWSSYTTKKYWTLSSDEGEKTVYYNCRDYKGKDLGTAQATIEYSQKNPDSPSSLSIKINNGASHTKERDVQLTLKAKNADACKYKNEGGSWTDYESYRTSKSWTLTEGEGKKTVYYKCKNDYGYAETSTSIYLDGTAPGPIDSLTASIDYNEVVHLAWERPTGTISEYQIYRSTSGLGDFTKIGSTQTTTYQDKTALEGYTYSYSVRAMDSAGNIAPDSNIATIDIPADAGGDTDEHGCIGSAGYEWCESLGECIRPWETECP